ncbi:MAG: D-ribose pyranase [Clostridiales bacterium]|jgi:D-ribose pyranase|nr:D-ribose pyranase [Clostridiales bacterium]
MLKKGILNPYMAKVLASTGHADMLVVTDAGLPIPQEIERVDLSILPNLPRFLDVLKAVLDEIVVEKIIMSEEIKEESPDMLKEILKLFPDDIEVEFMPHTNFKEKTKSARAAFRSGEFTHYANIILVAGVAY